MRQIRLIFLFCALTGWVAGQDLPIPDEGPWLIKATVTDPSQAMLLESLADVWNFDVQTRELLIMADAQVLSVLGDLNLVWDLDETRTQAFHSPPSGKRGDSGIPFYPCYPTVAETFALMDQWVAQYPHLAEIIDIGDSWAKTQNPMQGYDLRVLKLTNTSVAGPKPVLYAQGALHAREYPTAALLTDFAEMLLTDYDRDADITWLLDHREIHLLLIANPDGRVQAESGLSWRKNANNDFCTGTNVRGVDLNRNFPYEWGCCGGSSTSECSTTFRGPSDASEPETQAITNYVRSIFPDQRLDNPTDAAPTDATGVFLDIHNFGGCVLWPFGYDCTPSPNGVALQTFARKLANYNGYQPEKASHNFNTDGTTDDFAYGELGVAAFTFELGDNGSSFFENCTKYENEVRPGNLPALLYAAKVADTPFLTPAGPDVTALQLCNSFVTAGTIVNLDATLNDTGFRNGSCTAFFCPSPLPCDGPESTHTIASVQFTIDTPIWSADPGQINTMTASDGNFDTSVEAAQSQIDTTLFDEGRHTVYVRGVDASGATGAVSAVFLHVVSPLPQAYESWPSGLDIRDLIYATFDSGCISR